MLLRYFDRAGVEADFDVGSGDLCLRPSSDFGRLLRESEGVFTLLGGVALVLVTSEAGVILRIGSRSGALNSLRVDVSGGQGGRTLRIHWPSGEVDQFGYAVSGWIEFDPTPGVEREDFDFGLFLRNVRYDLERQRRMCGLSDD